jgi:hypothetical protein
VKVLLVGEVDMVEQPNISRQCPVRSCFPLWPTALIVTVVYALSIYANLAFTVTDKANFRYFPPFKRYVNGNMSRHLVNGTEYGRIARSLLAGQGFAHPFNQPTGPTTWMPPALPVLLAGLLWVCDGDQDTAMAVLIFVQVNVLILTGLLVVALARQTTRRLGVFAAAVLFLLGLLCEFRLWFQFMHDCWLILLTLDVLIAGFCWFDPLQRWQKAAGWGVLGGLCALISPITGFTWGVFSFLTGLSQRAWTRLGVAVLVAGLTVAPWTIRNYFVFGRLIPVKSNLAYELYQSQCLQPDGLIQRKTFSAHPINAGTREGQEYKQLGEIAFVERKKEQFWQSVWADPLDFLDRVASRFLGTTLWYEPFDRGKDAQQTWVLWVSRFTHPLPFLALLVLVFMAVRERLHGSQWVVMSIYVIYLLPYIGASYYERYGAPLVGVKVLLVIWAVDRLWTWFRQDHGAEEPGERVRVATSPGRQAEPVPVSS